MSNAQSSERPEFSLHGVRMSAPRGVGELDTQGGTVPRSDGVCFTRPSGEEPTENVWRGEEPSVCHIQKVS